MVQTAQGEFLMGALPLPQIEFVMGYWDGPIRGLASWQGQTYYFLWNNPQEQEHNPYACRKYKLLALAPEQLQEMKTAQAMFERYVGTHQTYVSGVKAGAVHHDTDHSIFYAWHKEHPDSFDPSTLPVVAFTDLHRYVERVK